MSGNHISHPYKIIGHTGESNNFIATMGGTCPKHLQNFSTLKKASRALERNPSKCLLKRQDSVPSTGVTLNGGCSFEHQFYKILNSTFCQHSRP